MPFLECTRINGRVMCGVSPSPSLECRLLDVACAAMPYQPIEDYGIIGNLRTAALVGKNGSIDWLCYPQFDSPSVFGAILDDKKGGHFRISPVTTDITLKQLYWPDTNVLVTRFLSADGVGEVVD